MAIKNSNCRLTITLSKKQANWLNTTAKELEITTSQFIKWLIDKNISRIMNKYMSKEQNNRIIELAQKNWEDFNDPEELNEEESRELEQFFENR